MERATKCRCLIYDEEKKLGAMSKSEWDAFMGECFACEVRPIMEFNQK
jgi:hypothetical protein